MAQLLGNALVVGGTAGIGAEFARQMNAAGLNVWVAGRDMARSQQAAMNIGPGVQACAIDLARPDTIAPGLAALPQMDYVVLSAMERDGNHVKTYDAVAAMRTVTVKMVGYVEVLHALNTRLAPSGAVLLLGGAAFLRPSAGSVTTAAIGAGVNGLCRSLAVQLAPVRVTALHPGLVDGTALRGNFDDQQMAALMTRIPSGHLPTKTDVVDMGLSMLSNRGMNGTDVIIDGGWLCL